MYGEFTVADAIVRNREDVSDDLKPKCPEIINDLKPKVSPIDQK